MKKTFLSIIEGLMTEKMEELAEAVRANNRICKLELENDLKTLKLMKADLIKKNDASEYKLTEDEELTVFIKMVEQRLKSITEYKKGGRLDLVEEEEKEIKVIYSIHPKVKEHFDSLPNDEDIANYTRECIKNYLLEKGDGYALSMRDMGALVKAVKTKYNNADGNIIKTVLQEAIS